MAGQQGQSPPTNQGQPATPPPDSRQEGADPSACRLSEDPRLTAEPRCIKYSEREGRRSR